MISTRPLHDILCHPQSDQEEQIADEHIKRECERIRDGWDHDVRIVRETGVRGTGVERFGWEVPVICTDGLDDPSKGRFE